VVAWCLHLLGELIDPAVVIERYRGYFTDDQIAEIVQLAQLETE
jgi:hypothetical protein